MSKSFISALLCAALSSASHAALAQNLESTAPAAAPSDETPKLVFGGLLLGVSSAAAVAADVTGGWAIAGGIGCGLGGDCSDSDNRAQNVLANAAIGLAVAAAVTAAIGIPLVVSAHNGRRAKKPPVDFSVAPTLGGSQGSGVSASLALHF